MVRQHNTKLVTATIASAAAAYSSGDQVGVPVELVGALSQGRHITRLASLLARCQAATTAPLDVLLFNSQPTATSGDNDAINLDATALGKIIGMPQILAAHITDVGSHYVGHVAQADLGFSLKPLYNTQTSLWALVIARGGTTFAANGIQLLFGFEE